jgi:hypothetical protein
VTTRRLLALVAVCGVLAFIVAFGIQRLTSGGAPVPTAIASSAVAPTGLVSTGSPTASNSKIGLPNGTLTPGAINPDATPDDLSATVCKSGWATSVRPPSAYTAALKLVQIVEYGYADRNPSHYQEDHLVPLELGGAPRDKRNLWPEPNVAMLPDGTAVGSAQKDALEDALHARVCDAGLALGDAQRMIAVDWVAAWEAAGRP